jgi:hypothetical protein
MFLFQRRMGVKISMEVLGRYEQIRHTMIKDLYKPFIKSFLEDGKFREKVVRTLERKGFVH